MKLEESVAKQKASMEEALRLRDKKGHDYAKPDADCLSNFKVMADVASALKKNGYEIPIDKAHGVAFWHMLHKMIRILNFWNEEIEPQCEGLRDSHIDLMNYNFLAEHCYEDYLRENPKIKKLINKSP